jgi:thymidylate kinase
MHTQERRANNKISFRNEPDGSSIGKKIKAGDKINTMLKTENELFIASRHELYKNIP